MNNLDAIQPRLDCTELDLFPRVENPPRIGPSTKDSRYCTGTPMIATTDLWSTNSTSALMPSVSRRSP